MLQSGMSLEIGITGLSQEGRGVGRSGGIVVFVDDLVPGDFARVLITQVWQRHASAVPERILKPSPHRCTPFCRDFDRCGGCTLQHYSYTAQLIEKRRHVVDALERIGHIEDAESLTAPMVGMDDPLAYRSTVRLPVGGTVQHPLVGFYAGSSHDVVDAAQCRIQHPVGDSIRNAVRSWMKTSGVVPYDEWRRRGQLRHVVIRTGFSTGQVMVVLGTNGDMLPALPALLVKLQEAIAHHSGLTLASVCMDVKGTRASEVPDGEIRILYGAPAIEEVLAGMRFRLSPHAFFQVNPRQTELLYAAALDSAALRGHETVYDLYCGTGTISLFLAGKAARVIGIESCAPAVADAKANALMNGATNVDFIVGEAESVVPERYARGERADVVVVDPPRKGCDPRLLDTLIAMAPQRIVYVSCAPATMARDVARLAGSGYQVRSVKPIDMFPWTTHVETVVLMSRGDMKK